MDWSRELAKLYSPRRLVLSVPAGAQDLPPALADKTVQGDAAAYVCRGSTCSAPIASLAELIRELRGESVL